LLKEKIVKNNGSNSLLCKLEMKFADMMLKGVWSISLIKTSVQVTRTPMTTLKSILKINLGLRMRGKTNLNLNHQLIHKTETESVNLLHASPLAYRFSLK